MLNHIMCIHEALSLVLSSYALLAATNAFSRYFIILSQLTPAYSWFLRQLTNGPLRPSIPKLCIPPTRLSLLPCASQSDPDRVRHLLRPP
jgi:hypothetical protein